MSTYNNFQIENLDVLRYSCSSFYDDQNLSIFYKHLLDTEKITLKCKSNNLKDEYDENKSWQDISSNCTVKMCHNDTDKLKNYNCKHKWPDGSESHNKSLIFTKIDMEHDLIILLL